MARTLPQAENGGQAVVWNEAAAVKNRRGARRAPLRKTNDARQDRGQVRNTLFMNST
jgi:hypothetical protein